MKNEARRAAQYSSACPEEPDQQAALTDFNTTPSPVTEMVQVLNSHIILHLSQ